MTTLHAISSNGSEPHAEWKDELALHSYRNVALLDEPHREGLTGISTRPRFFETLSLDIRLMIYDCPDIHPLLVDANAYKGFALSCSQAHNELLDHGKLYVKGIYTEFAAGLENNTAFAIKLELDWDNIKTFSMISNLTIYMPFATLESGDFKRILSFMELYLERLTIYLVGPLSPAQATKRVWHIGPRSLLVTKAMTFILQEIIDFSQDPGGVHNLLGPTTAHLLRKRERHIGTKTILLDWEDQRNDNKRPAKRYPLWSITTASSDRRWKYCARNEEIEGRPCIAMAMHQKP
ncbi:hypothetical protein BDV96DRAFT_651828 [Lophiotrema nucula]|uniref:Uncharacterized protein n=1 Tax=Lophiotrema nucula TaxID=690887 RepID=A0A6A5YQ74_9PLEO|nr:hypothetical protein BDV96DRAFT_651828 [Lophiotrema nucula]